MISTKVLTMTITPPLRNQDRAETAINGKKRREREKERALGKKSICLGGGFTRYQPWRFVCYRRN